MYIHGRMQKLNLKGLVVSLLLMQVAKSGCSGSPVLPCSALLAAGRDLLPLLGPQWAPPSPKLPACPFQAYGYLLQPKETALCGVLRRRQIPPLGSNSSSEESGSPSILDKDCKITELAVPSAELSFNEQSCFLIWRFWSVGLCETPTTVINHRKRLVTLLDQN